ncbi:hypothetical protein AX774_g3626 [Zancudomyces culisetae]|uniref:Uncharacterized protein n=1 Tax=Zancudomyces culisetae TaxID=1213189 RepID=A0A1R1PPH9_ZANCU|nr:hypothetical protein AX774_g3626 [Zancudomyces culisetae]|eukprot:OMH82885.1 hypothetical protein AX774_g3626 [Zancudomyces culisetae]
MKKAITRELVEGDKLKLGKTWEGPYQITRELNKGVYVITDNTGRRELCNGDSLKLYRESEHMIPDVGPRLQTRLRRFKQIRDPSIRA